MKEYVLVASCPIHKNYPMVSHKEDIIIIGNLRPRKYYCPLCNRYYIQSPKLGINQKLSITINGKEVYRVPLFPETSENNPEKILQLRRAYKSTFNNDVQRKINDKSEEKNIEKGDKRKRKKKMLPPEKCKITIHVFNSHDDTQKVSANYSNVQRSYPRIAPKQMSLNRFLKKVLPSGIPQDMVFRNKSYINKNGKSVGFVEMYNTNCSFLKGILPDNTYILFEGRLVGKELVIKGMRIIDNPVQSPDDIEQKVIFGFEKVYDQNWLYEIAKYDGKRKNSLQNELLEWNNYLEWKQKLIELRTQGVKYIGYKINMMLQEITFLVVTEGQEGFEKFERYLRGDSILIYSNYYSDDRWHFKYGKSDQEEDYSGENGIELPFLRVNLGYGSEGIDTYTWDYTKNYARKYEGEAEYINTKKLLDNIINTYDYPFFYELVFGFSVRATETIERLRRRGEEISEQHISIVGRELFPDGFIVTSQIGDLALIKRLQYAVNDLRDGKAASEALDKWLFDIKQARKPKKIEYINEWQNKNLNYFQKQAVNKILSVPDVCLLQGPPGTGKTTVIAEAIYQLVIRDKRVLIASQANLAVDNALDRLITNPKIRAIRLGSESKIDDSIKNITEDNVLGSFYNSIVSYVDENYLKQWDFEDLTIKTAEDDYADFCRINDTVSSIQKEVKEKENQLSDMKTGDLIDEIEKLKNQTVASDRIDKFIKNEVEEIDVGLESKYVAKIWDAIEPLISECAGQGLRLTRASVNVEKLDDEDDLNYANEIIKTVYSNCKRAEQLRKRLQKSVDFGGISEKAEILQRKIEGLTKKLLSDSSKEVLEDWRKAQQELLELKNQGGLSDLDVRLFNDEYIKGLSGVELQKKLIDVLEKCCVVIESIYKKTVIIMEEIRTDIDERALDYIDDKNELLGKEKECSHILDDLRKDLEKCIKDKDIILKKYNCSEEQLKQRIESVIHKKRTDLGINRTTWEPIFRGFKEWVHSIPDYHQENELYLKEYINGCNVVGVSCTENTKTLRDKGFEDFDVVIIDEVSKATPPELLIPMLKGRKIVLVGDHRQLPPLFNEHEKSYQEVAEQQSEQEDTQSGLTMEEFEKYKDMVTSSLFEKAFENADDSLKQVLRYQYRMHRDIMDVINIFYDGKLIDGNAEHENDSLKAHNLNILSCFGTPMIVPDKHAYWFDSSVLQNERIFETRRDGSTSAENIVEAEMILELLKKMENEYANQSEKKSPVTVGVISFYYDQVKLIRQVLSKESFFAIDVEINTVDKYQGKEKEIIIVSLVRNVKTNVRRENSHVAVFQRINVAFSRAQKLLIIVGAKDMYADQPVRLTGMEDGEEKTVMAYRQILEMMNNKGTYYYSDDVISDVKAEEILDEYHTRLGGYKA